MILSDRFNAGFANGNRWTGRAPIQVVIRRRGPAPRYDPPISLVLAARSRDFIGSPTALHHLGTSDGEMARARIATWS
jgi:hypothetical protein